MFCRCIPLLLFAAVSFVALNPLAAQTKRLNIPTHFVPGYGTTLKGEELRYHSPLPYVDRSLLVRSIDSARSIEWETSAIPDAFDGDEAIFVIMAGIDVNDNPRRFDLTVNGDYVLSFVNPRQSSAGDTIVWTGERGVRAEFRVTLIDKYGDAMGYIFLRVPREIWRGSRFVRLGVAGERAGVPTWFMIFKESVTPHIIVQNAPALLRGERGNTQIVRVDLLYLGDDGNVQLTSPIGSIDTTVSLGHSRYLIPVPEADETTPVDLSFQVDGRGATTTFAVQPVRRIDMYLIHHTHLDIGYTHHQDEVEQMQWDHLEEALRLGAASEGYPEEARFVWNPEGLWAVESYFENHTEQENERLLEGIRRGWIKLDGMYANLLTGIATSEGLMRSLEASRRLGDATGVAIESAILSDIPGFTWGLVPVLAQNGIKYLSIGPNFGHRIGYFLDELGDRPFYWESPSGEDRVLTWVSGAGYALFHSGLGYSQITKALDEENVFGYVEQLGREEYPFDIVYLRYNIGSDNGPPDPNLADAVRAWNERFVSPRLAISTVSDVFAEFEARYGNQLPVLRGDLTGHWEDGAASSARETASVRRVAESLAQTEALAAIFGVELPDDELREAWRNVILYYEHTWGSWNSISEPRSEFTLSQWEHKKEFAEVASLQARRLRLRTLTARLWNRPSAGRFEVVNTSSWPRTDVVTLSAEESAFGDVVLDESGRPVLSQRLSTGELVFLASDVPAFGSMHFTVSEGEAARRSASRVRHNVLANSEFRIEVDTTTGAIVSLYSQRAKRDLVYDGQDGRSVNRYFYVPGRDPAAAVTSGRAAVRLKEYGPLVSAVEIVAPAAGVDQLLRNEIRIYERVPRIDLINWLYKRAVHDPEAVLYEFAFNVRDPRVRVDVPWGSFRLEEDQLPGASKNYMSLQRWVDVHNDFSGMTLVSIDVPMIQFGSIRTDAIVTGWLHQIPQSATVYSYVMNNYWETNYKAAQDGFHEFRYSLRPHGSFDEAVAERFAMEIGQPLIVVAAPPDSEPLKFPVRVEADRAVVTLLKTADDGSGLFIRLFNPGESADAVRFVPGEGATCSFFRSDVRESELDALPETVELDPYQILAVRAVCSG
jgi:hypothetical protein